MKICGALENKAAFKDQPNEDISVDKMLYTLNLDMFLFSPYTACESSTFQTPKVCSTWGPGPKTNAQITKPWL